MWSGWVIDLCRSPYRKGKDWRHCSLWLISILSTSSENANRRGKSSVLFHWNSEAVKTTTAPFFVAWGKFWLEYLATSLADHLLLSCRKRLASKVCRSATSRTTQNWTILDPLWTWCHHRYSDMTTTPEQFEILLQMSERKSSAYVHHFFFASYAGERVRQNPFPRFFIGFWLIL